jgi:hypothetical protein
MRWIQDDGGRAAAGFKGSAGDCTVRAIAIATGLPYRQVYDALNVVARDERPRAGRRRSSARTGMYRKTSEAYLAELGWRWVPTMRVGQGCRVHLREEELPGGRIIVRLTRHLAAVIDGVVYDTHDPSRGGSRCVYGYYQQVAK